MYKRWIAFALCAVVGTGAARAATTTVHFMDQLGNPIVDEIAAIIDGEKRLLGRSPTGTFVLDLEVGHSATFAVMDQVVHFGDSGVVIAENRDPEITVTVPVDRRNEVCANALAVDLTFDKLVSTTGGGTDPILRGMSTGTATNLGNADGTWFSLIGTGGRVAVDTCGGADFDTQLAVFCTECEALTPITGNDDACDGLKSRVEWDTAAGVEYLVYLTGFQSSSGIARIRVEPVGENESQPVDCPEEEEGACCHDEMDKGQAADCSIESEDDCDDLGGIYLGDDTVCQDVADYVSSPGSAIDSALPPAVDTIDVTDSFVIEDLDVDFILTHTWIGDLTVTIEGPDGTVVTLQDAVCGSNDNENVVFDDEAGPLACGSPVTGGQPAPGALSAFDGLDAFGPWTITVADNVGGDTGTLDQWSLHFDKATSVCADGGGDDDDEEGACCTTDRGAILDCIEVSPAECRDVRGQFVGGSCDDRDVCEELLVELDSATATRGANGVTVRWVTAVEIDTIGFRVLREDGGRSKSLTDFTGLIPAAGHGLSGASYEVIDRSPAATGATNYWIYDIDIFGKVTRHGPIVVERPTRRDDATAIGLRDRR